ncbi:uncharacterized protein LOC114257164 [Camellia sinensis]|uniref:uncharacterized protein LOC114257164 n=1 Tax=Camellia sinensis TaxID=4442 RepID=UPI001036493E|nr:uncharacterized protein LOC114257164 [Camellia sinensis]
MDRRVNGTKPGFPQGVVFSAAKEKCTSSEAQKVQLAAFTLEDEARRWWMLTRTIHQGLTWDRFLELFYDKYFPQSMRDKKVTEFETLKQGNKTVAEYEAQFAELARFAPYMVDTDYKKARKFEGGLRSTILDKVNMLKLPTYVDVLERAVIAKGNLATQSRISEWKGKRQNTQWSKGSPTPPNKKQTLGSSNTSTPSQDSMPTCPECGKKHRGTCYRKSRACFQCDKTGHLIKDCPQRNQQSNNKTATSSAGSAPTSNTKTTAKPTNNKDTTRQGRVFALVPGDVQNAATVVSELVIHGQEVVLAAIMAQPTLLEEIKLHQMKDDTLKKGTLREEQARRYNTVSSSTVICFKCS